MTFSPFYIVLSFILTFTTAQKVQAQVDCDYISQSFSILQQAIYDELVMSDQEWDSAHVLLDGDVLMNVTSDSTSYSLLSADFDVNRKSDSRVVSISAPCVTASYAYNLFGKLKSIRFKYAVGIELFEGTWSKMVFDRESDRLVYVGDNVPDDPIFKIQYFD